MVGSSLKFHVTLVLSISLVMAAESCSAGTIFNTNLDQSSDGANSSDNGSGTASGSGLTPTGEPLIPFEPQPSRIYVNKIKTLLTGLPATQTEISSGATDEGLATLVDNWMSLPAYSDALMTFFKLAFQTGSFDSEQISPQIPYGNHGPSVETPMMIESFPRTALYFVQNNIPFTEVATTNRFMMTTRLLMFYALMDQFGDGKSETGDYLKSQLPDQTYTFSATGGASSLEDVSNPASANFMNFPWNGIKAPGGQCTPDTCMQNCGKVVIPSSFFTYSRGGNVWGHLAGHDFIYYVQPGNSYCLMPGSSLSFFIPTDDTDWRMVNFRTPNAGEKPFAIYDLLRFRKASEVVLRIPRVGFFTNPTFLAQWQSNTNNQSRVTINQTMIVGLERVFDGSDMTMPQDLRALPLDHAKPSTSCYSCHLTMDPMRQYFNQTLGYSYHLQLDPNQTAIPGAWAQKGVAVAGGNLAQLGRQIAADPEFATAWVLKVCSWLNSSPCVRDDKEVKRIADRFASNKFNFNSMMKDVLTSPLTTYKSSTLTATTRGAVSTIARRDQFCKILGARLNKPAVCSDVYMMPLLAGFPRDGYSRATTVMAQARAPNLTTRIVTENICGMVSQSMIDSGAGSFSSQDPSKAIVAIGSTLMGLDPAQNSEEFAILNTHFSDVKAAGLSDSDALRSTFILACLSPQVTSLGQ